MSLKLAWIHDHKFMRNDQGDIFSRTFSYKIWARYLKHFDDIVVVGRCGGRRGVVSAANFTPSGGANVTFFLLENMVTTPQMFMKHPVAQAKIKNILKTVDAVVVRQSKLGWLAAREAQCKGLPWAVEVVGDAWDAYWNYGTLIGKVYAPVAWWNSRHWIGKADFATYVTREYLQKRYPCRGVSCGVSDVEISPVSTSVLEQRIAQWCTKESGCSRKISIGLIGSLDNRYKGLQVAMRALCRLKAQGILVHLHVLGDGKKDGWCKEANQLGIGDLLFFDGCLPSGAPVMEWLDRLDGYIQPSFQEGLPRALIEAMSRGLPALGSSCGGVPELLSPECLHHPGDDKELAGQLAKMVRDCTWRIQQARSNFIEAQNYYSDRVESKRDAFWQQFVEHVIRVKG